MKRRIRMKSLKGIALVSLLASATLLSGCGASNAMKMQMDEVKATADEALRTANTADYNAAVAKDMADEALTMMQRKGMRKGKKGMMMKYNK